MRRHVDPGARDLVVPDTITPLLPCAPELSPADTGWQVSRDDGRGKRTFASSGDSVERRCHVRNRRVAQPRTSMAFTLRDWSRRSSAPLMAITLGVIFRNSPHSMVMVGKAGVRPVLTRAQASSIAPPIPSRNRSQLK